jgi:ribosomal-protein-alanine N-acetyltransferase
MFPNHSLLLRDMTIEDIPQVMNIDRLSFDVPWSETSYRYEINNTSYSYMVVLEYRRHRPIPRWQRWLNVTPKLERRIVGYGGMWFIQGEAHISTIAVHPRARGRGWGEVLLAAMVQRGIHLGATEVGLEVRVTNATAQNLYRKWGFQIADVKKGYYRNNDEDAYDMRLTVIQPAVQALAESRWNALAADHNIIDQYTRNQP